MAALASLELDDVRPAVGVDTIELVDDGDAQRVQLLSEARPAR